MATDAEPCPECASPRARSRREQRATGCRLPPRAALEAPEQHLQWERAFQHNHSCVGCAVLFPVKWEEIWFCQGICDYISLGENIKVWPRLPMAGYGLASDRTGPLALVLPSLIFSPSPRFLDFIRRLGGQRWLTILERSVKPSEVIAEVRACPAKLLSKSVAVSDAGIHLCVCTWVQAGCAWPRARLSRGTDA